MDRYQRKINFLTKIKASFGIDTRSDEIDMELNDLKNEQNKVNSNIQLSENKLNIIDNSINNIDKIFSFALDDISKSNIYCFRLTSFQLKIDRAKKQHCDISNITAMQLEYENLKRQCMYDYIDDIINEKVFDNDNNVCQIHILLDDIKHNYFRLKKENLIINNAYDLEVLRNNLLSVRNSFKFANDDNYSISNELNRRIVDIEISKEKYYADLAKEQANRKRR